MTWGGNPPELRHSIPSGTPSSSESSAERIGTCPVADVLGRWFHAERTRHCAARLRPDGGKNNG